MSRRSELKPYIKSIWILASPFGMPASDTNLAAPDGCPKLIFNHQNSIISTVEGHTQESKEHCLYFVGTRESSALVRTTAGQTCCIGLEFYPHGAYPIFGIPMVETVNSLLPADVLPWGKVFCEMLQEQKRAKEAADFIQDRLVAMLRKRQLQNSVVEYCVDSLKSTYGLVAISSLERKTGYTRRYLEILFRDHVGFSPKTLASIFRFQKFYRSWAQGCSYEEAKGELYNYYYDQAHFAKEFKRMTGFSPQYFTRQVSNEFGRRLSLH